MNQFQITSYAIIIFSYNHLFFLFHTFNFISKQEKIFRRSGKKITEIDAASHDMHVSVRLGIWRPHCTSTTSTIIAYSYEIRTIMSVRYHNHLSEWQFVFSQNRIWHPTAFSSDSIIIIVINSVEYFHQHSHLEN